MGYKYIPSLDGPPDADYPTVYWNDYKFAELWLGKKGELFLSSLGEKDIGMSAKILDALKTLPVLEVTQTVHGRGSMVLRWDKYKRLC